MAARYAYMPLYGYNKGVRGLKPPARIIGWDVRDNDSAPSDTTSLIVTVASRSEARAIVSRLNKQQRVIGGLREAVKRQERLVDRVRKIAQ